MLLNYLVNIDELFANWRYKHSMMVHRMIGTEWEQVESQDIIILKQL